MSTKGNRELIGLGLIMGGVLVALAVAYVRNVHDSFKQNASISERIELVQALRLALAATSEAQNSAVMANREHDSKSFVEEARMENAAFDRGRVKLAEHVKQRADKNEVGLIEKVDQTFREFQLLLLPHIAESSDQKMDDLEAQIAEEDRGIRKNLESLTKLLSHGDSTGIATITSRYHEFEEIRTRIINLSRENTDIRSVAIALNEKRKAMLACEDALASLENAIRSERIANTLPSGRGQ